MNWLKEQNRQTKEFLRGDFSSTLRMCAVAFAVLIVLGFVAGFFLKDFAASFVAHFAQQVENMGITKEDGTISALALLSNNARATFFTVLYGFIPFFYLPAISLGMNSILLGAFAAYYVNNGMSMLFYFAALIPHGLFELPALVIAVALGIYLCRQINAFVRHNTKGVILPVMLNILRVLILRVLPLLVIASVIEAYITPVIAGLV